MAFDLSSQLAQHSHWPLHRIKDHVVKLGSGITPSGGATSYLESGIPLLRSQNVHFDGLRLDDVAFISEETHAEMSGSQLREGDVLLNITGASIGRCAVVPVGFGEGNVNQHVCIVRPSAKVVSKFINYYLASAWGQDQIFSSFTGASRQGLGLRDLGSIQIPLPSVVIQQRIAAYLDASCAAIDAAIAAKRRQIETLDALRASTLQRVITQGLTPDGPMVETGNPWLERVPAGWSLVQLKRIAAVHGGLTLGKSYEGEALVEYPYLRVANVQDGHVDLTDVSTLEVPPAVAAGVMLRAGDVLMTEGGDLDKLGRGTVWARQLAPCLHQNHVFAVRCIAHKVLPHFLAYVTASRYGRDYFEATGKRTTNLAATNATKVGAFYIPLPSLAEQAELVAYLDTEIGRLRAIQEVIGKQIDTLTAYRKSLIHECVTGQRRIGEAELAAAGAHP